jgi:hypothetical protein
MVDRRLLAVGCAGCLVAAVALWSAVGTADGEHDSGPRVIPYTGTLDHDGEAFTGTVDLTVVLAWDDDGAQTFQHSGVTVAGGEFHINIGSTDTVDDGFWSGANQRVAIGLDDPDHDEAFWLGGDSLDDAYRAIRAAPFAYWSASATDLHVDGAARLAAVRVDGETTVDTDAAASATSLTVQGALRADEVNFQRLGQASAALEGTSGPTLGLTADAQATGVRFTVAGQTILAVTDDGATAYRDVVVTGDADADQSGLIETTKEAAVSVTACATLDTSEQTATLGENDGERFCALTYAVYNRAAVGTDQLERCRIATIDGDFVLGVTQDHQGADGSCLTCRAQCISW